MNSVRSLNNVQDVDAIVESVFSVFQQRGGEEYHGEPVSQMEHAVQTAELARAAQPDDAEFVLAAFLHDFGHIAAPAGTVDFMEKYGVRSHEEVGAQILRHRGFSEKIVRLVAGHVEAKRYLVSTQAEYIENLSEASKITLAHQGGPMSPEEQKEFEEDTLFDLHLRLRRLDEQAKVSGQPIPDLGWLEKLLRKHLLQRM